jgi:hypothetical protein
MKKPVNSALRVGMIQVEALPCLCTIGNVFRPRYTTTFTPFPPGPQDPQSLHKLIWDEFDEDTPFELPADEPLLLVSYRAAAPLVEFTPGAVIEPLRVGSQLPDMPAWLDPDLYVNVPLEKSYMAAWDVCPRDFQ